MRSLASSLSRILPSEGEKAKTLSTWVHAKSPGKELQSKGGAVASADEVAEEPALQVFPGHKELLLVGGLEAVASR